MISDVKICTFISDHALVKCSIDFHHQVAHIPNKVQYRRYHCINMSTFHSGLKDTSFVKSPAGAVVNLYEQYLHDLADVLDRHEPVTVTGQRGSNYQLPLSCNRKRQKV